MEDGKFGVAVDHKDYPGGEALIIDACQASKVSVILIVFILLLVSAHKNAIQFSCSDQFKDLVAVVLETKDTSLVCNDNIIGSAIFRRICATPPSAPRPPTNLQTSNFSRLFLTPPLPISVHSDATLSQVLPVPRLPVGGCLTIQSHLTATNGNSINPNHLTLHIRNSSHQISIPNGAYHHAEPLTSSDKFSTGQLENALQSVTQEESVAPIIFNEFVLSIRMAK
jgi:hypothetical protein